MYKKKKNSFKKTLRKCFYTNIVIRYLIEIKTLVDLIKYIEIINNKYNLTK